MPTCRCSRTWIRSTVSGCSSQRKYRAAALFFEDARRFKPDDVGMIFTAGMHPLALIMRGDLSEAWEYIRHQLDVIRHAIPSINATEQNWP